MLNGKSVKLALLTDKKNKVQQAYKLVSYSHFLQETNTNDPHGFNIS